MVNETLAEAIRKTVAQWNSHPAEHRGTLQDQILNLLRKHGFNIRRLARALANALSKLEPEELHSDPIRNGIVRMLAEFGHQYAGRYQFAEQMHQWRLSYAPQALEEQIHQIVMDSYAHTINRLRDLLECECLEVRGCVGEWKTIVCNARTWFNSVHPSDVCAVAETFFESLLDTTLERAAA